MTLALVAVGVAMFVAGTVVGVLVMAALTASRSSEGQFAAGFREGHAAGRRMAVHEAQDLEHMLQLPTREGRA